MNTEAIEKEVRALEGLDLEGLRAEWRRRWKAPPPLRSPELLRHAIAWRIQAAAFGDLDGGTRRRLRRSQSTKVNRPRLSPGTKLAREWRGVVFEVEVREDGFHFNGQAYRSLSKIAGVITGVKWNGLRFFGVDCGASA